MVVALGHTHLYVAHNHILCQTPLGCSCYWHQYCLPCVSWRLYTDFTLGMILQEVIVSVSGTGSHMWRHFLKCKRASEPFFSPFNADQNGFIQETEITILKLPAEILYLYVKKMEFGCQMSAFSIATYLLCHSSCLKFPEPLI